LSIKEASFPTHMVDRLLSTLYSFVSCPFPSRSFATTLDGRLNLLLAPPAEYWR
jgi:hypothetical protein